ncbi:MAG: RNA polymerase sigma factor [Candidatus Kerfeldbacteria bacterium]|nr:RNA polymerase sigma factor [Candidatus Kerfeldbacteria bacterium]
MEVDQQTIDGLVSDAQRGDTASVGRLFDLLFDRVYRYVRFRVHGDDDAEDLTQIVFLEMIRSLPRYKQQEGVRFTTWLFQIARFRLIDHYRAARQDVTLDPELADTQPQLQATPRDFAALGSGEAIDRALAALPEQYQTVLHLRYREDCTTQEIAAVLDTTEGNVRVLQYRALNTLRDQLDLEKL